MARLDKHSFDVGLEVGAAAVPVILVALRKFIVRALYLAAAAMEQDVVRDYIKKHFMRNKKHHDNPQV